MPAAELDLVDERSIMQGDSWELTVTVGGGLYSGVDFSDPGWEFAASLRPGYSMVGTPVDFAVAVDEPERHHVPGHRLFRRPCGCRIELPGALLLSGGSDCGGVHVVPVRVEQPGAERRPVAHADDEVDVTR